MSWLLFVQILIILLMFGLVASFIIGMYFNTKERCFGDRVRAFNAAGKSILEEVTKQRENKAHQSMKELIDTLTQQAKKEQ